jgi:outer membrane protein assembly factor BamB
MRRWAPAATVVLLSTAPLAQTPAHEWPQYLGPSRNSVAPVPVPRTASLALAWKRPFPSGGAGIAVSGDRLYTLGNDDDQDVLYALAAASGKEEWRLVLGPTHVDAQFGPNATPALAGDRLIAVSSNCQVQAVNLQTRAVAWTIDLGAQFKSRFATRGGCGMSPLVVDDRVVIHTGAAEGPRLAALDVASGKTLWTADVPSAFASASGLLAHGTRVILYHHVKAPEASGITAVNASTGAIEWQIDGTAGASGVVPVPAGDGRVLLERWPHSTLYDIASKKPLWTTREMTALDSPAIPHAGHIYGFGGQSGEFLTCLDASTGEVKWSSRIYRGHLVLAGDTLVVLSSASGLVRLVAADPGSYRELASLQVLTPGARTQTPPSLAGGRIFARNLEEIVAVGLR